MRSNLLLPFYFVLAWDAEIVMPGKGKEWEKKKKKSLFIQMPFSNAFDN